MERNWTSARLELQSLVQLDNIPCFAGIEGAGFYPEPSS